MSSSVTPTPAQVRYGFLNGLAKGESDGDYQILFGGRVGVLSDGHHFTDFSHFPKWAGVRTKWGLTHAAGKFQFEPATWIGCQKALLLPDFSPDSQDKAAWWLAGNVYYHMTGRNLQAALLADTLSKIVPALQSTWTSLNPATFPSRYHGFLAEAVSKGL